MLRPVDVTWSAIADEWLLLVTITRNGFEVLRFPDMQSSFSLTYVELPAVPTVSLINNPGHLSTGESVFVGKIPTLFTNLASKMLLTSCHANLFRLTLPETQWRTTLTLSIVDSLPPAGTLQELLIASESDPTLKIITGNCDTAPEPYKALKDEICQKAMRPCILQLAHDGHQGIPKVTQHLRQRVWWPGMDMQAERHVRECLGCQIMGPKPPLDPLNMTKPPKQVWHTIHVDYCGPFPSGEYLCCSRWIL